MAYVNVKEWSVEQVTDWLKGLDVSILQYTNSFLNNAVTGHQLLNLRADDLEHLGVIKLGHQEIILEAVEHLRNFHFELDKENLQMLALRLSCAANSLYKELLLVNDDASVVTQTMADVHSILTAIKPLVCWLDRSPFDGNKEYIEKKIALLELGFELATNAHRGIFSEKPVVSIRKICEKLTKIADFIIQEIHDPMILQPACLDLVTFKKKDQQLGLCFMPSNHAVHQIASYKFGSPAHGGTKIEAGDEIVQVNYQTVVGWQLEHVTSVLALSPPEIVLTLKKRPRHTKVYGQMYMKPYRLPSRKNGDHPYSRWNDNLPSPVLLPIGGLSSINLPKFTPVETHTEIENEDLSSSDSEEPDSPLDGTVRMYPLKPRPILQRRNTISGATPTSKRPLLNIEQYWMLLKNQANSASCNIQNSKFEEDPQFMRDKSASCNLGIDFSPRPTTCIGLPSTNKIPSFKNDFKEKRPNKKHVNFQEKVETDTIKNETSSTRDSTNLDSEYCISTSSLTSLSNKDISFIDEGRDLTDRSSMLNDWKKEIFEEIFDTLNKPKESSGISSITPPTPPVNTPTPIKDEMLADVDIGKIIKKFNTVNEEPNTLSVKPKVFPRQQIKKPPEVPQKPDHSKKPAVPPRSANTKLRGKLDKSHSTPAYDLTGEENSTVERFTPDVEVVEIDNSLKPLEKESQAEPLAENKYELGIPIVEAVNLPVTQTVKSQTTIITLSESINEKQDETQEEDKVTDIDVPPKPPPRVVDMPKPVYPADSPKPANLLELAKNNLTRLEQKPIFEFPETRYLASNQLQIKNESPEWSPKPDVLPLKPYQTEEHIKHFEPKMVSTPIRLKESDNTNTLTSYKSSNYEMQKSFSENKISPTNSIVRNMIYANKNKSKKKNTLVAKRRKVSVADLSPADLQGFLYQRLRNKQTQKVHWEKRWFVLLGNYLYGFKSKEDPKAACLIFLSGYTVAVATEVNSRSNAFKVYHTGTAFYFSAEDSDSLQSWIELITSATLHSETPKTSESALYSETDESDNEKPKLTSTEKTSESIKKFGSLKKFTSKKSQENSQNGSTSLDRKWFFNKSSSQSKNSLPVPTAQFRSYRKIRANDENTSVTTGNFTSHVPLFAPRSEIKTLSQSQAQNISVPNLTVDHIAKLNPDPVKLSKLNFVHASNPSLCNIQDFSVPTFKNKKLSKPINENLAGFVTLEELMIKQSEERKMNPHFNDTPAINFSLIKPDVVYGEVPIRPREKNEKEEKPEPISITQPVKRHHHSRSSSDSQKSSDKKDGGSSCFGRRLGSLKKTHKDECEYESKTATFPKAAKGADQKLNRSLPRTHKLQGKSNYLDCGTALSSSSYIVDISKDDMVKKHSYEMIYCPQTVNDVHFAQNRNLDDRMYHDTPKKSNKLQTPPNFNSSGRKAKFDISKSSSKISDSSTSKIKLKSAMQYTPMALPLSQDPKAKPKFAFELSLDEKSNKSGKLKQIFGKQAEPKKEKTFLGSPKLHRAIFSRHNSGPDVSWPLQSPQIPLSQSTYSLENNPTAPESIPLNVSPHPDYPGLEYPPVFKEETYSLADPQVSLNLLRKRSNQNTEASSLNKYEKNLHLLRRKLYRSV